MNPLNIQIADLSLDTVVGADYPDGPLTLADMIVSAAVAKLSKEGDYQEVHTGLRDRVRAIRDEEIRKLVQAELIGAMAEPIYKTNGYGERIAGTITMRELIVEHAKDFFNKKLSKDYGRHEYTAAQAVVAEAVGKALTKELTDAIAEEKAKVVKAVQGKAAELLAQAVKDGLR